jgi:hypothetical protein
MAQQDSELDRLKLEQDRAFQRKQDAWQAQDQAWNRRQAARETMDRAYAEMQSEYETQNDAWQALQRVRDYNGPRIDSLNSQQETAFENMKAAFDNASSAHDSRDGLSARMYADQGHEYKAEAQQCVAERRGLVEEIREARARHEATKPSFQRAKADFDQARAEHNRLKVEHERARDEFKSAKADFGGVKNAFQARLEVVRAERQQRKNDKRSLAEQAGVPSQYLDDVWVSAAPDGSVNIYFGGIGEPSGEGHGHYAMDSYGNVTYQRDPFDPHGAENFTDYEERARRDDQRSTWTPRGSEPPYVGIVEGTEGGLENMVSFKTGGPTGDQTLIADGDFSDDAEGFKGPRGNRNHNHYGSKAEKGPEDEDRWIDEDRGKYTGPGH